MLSLSSKYLTLSTGKQIITIHILTIISRCKSNQTVKFLQLTGNNMRNTFFFKNYPENEARSLVPEFFSFFRKAFY